MTTTIFEQKSQPKINEGGTPEHDLWTCVLSKAAHDALHCTDWRESRAAISWFKTGGFNFRTVCELPGREHEYVQRVMQHRIKKREHEMRRG